MVAHYVTSASQGVDAAVTLDALMYSPDLNVLSNLSRTLRYKNNVYRYSYWLPQRTILVDAICKSKF